MIEMSAAVAAAGTPAFEPVWAWGLAVIRAFQSAGNPALTLIARFFTLVGEPAVYVLILPVVFWCVDEKRGFKLGIVTMLSNGINVAIKETLRVPRPFTRDPSIQMIAEKGFSTPSGHSQNSAAFFPVLLCGKASPHGEPKPKGRAFRIAAAVALPICIGVSRVYLGVHYPTDVLFGWTLGALISTSALFIIPATVRSLAQVAPVRAVVDSYKRYREEGGRSLRTFKIAAAAIPAFVLNAASRGDSSMGGMLFGFATGYILLTDGGKEDSTESAAFSASSGSLAKKTARLVTGLAILALVFMGLKMALPGEGSEWYSLCRFVRYGLTGFWASWGAPKFFLKIGLA